MKIAGQTIPRPTGKLVVFPRGEASVALKVNPVISRRTFDDVCPFPKMPQKRVRNQRLPVDNPEDPRWPDMQRDYSIKYMDWLCISSLTGADKDKPTEDGPPIEWERVSMKDPGSWHQWRIEMEEAGFTAQEVNVIVSMVTRVNGLNEEYLDEAREAFLQEARQGPETSSSPEIELNSTPNSEPVNGSV